MTPETIIEMALDNVGLGSTSQRVIRARQYLNETAHMIYTWAVPIPGIKDRRAIKWVWALKETTLATVASTREYSLAADVLEPYEYFDTTNDRWVPLDWISTTDHLDPDEDETGGNAERISITGRDATTGYWTVDIYPTPDAVASIRYRYYAQWVDLVAADHTTDLNPKLPEWLQPALRFGIEELYFRENADLEFAGRAQSQKERIIHNAVARNTQGRNGSFRLQRPNANRRFVVQEGSLT